MHSSPLFGLLKKASSSKRHLFLTSSPSSRRPSFWTIFCHHLRRSGRQQTLSLWSICSTSPVDCSIPHFLTRLETSPRPTLIRTRKKIPMPSFSGFWRYRNTYHCHKSQNLIVIRMQGDYPAIPIKFEPGTDCEFSIIRMLWINNWMDQLPTDIAPMSLASSLKKLWERRWSSICTLSSLSKPSIRC